MTTPHKGGVVYLPPFWSSLPSGASDIAVLQHDISRMLAPLLRRIRTHGRVGNGSITDVHTALARALDLAERGGDHWLAVDYSVLVHQMTPDLLVEPLRCGSLTPGFVRLVESLIISGDDEQLPRHGPLQRTLIDFFLSERIDHVLRDSNDDSIIVTRVGTEVAAICRTPSALKTTWGRLCETVYCGEPTLNVTAAFADTGAGESIAWLGYRVSRRQELQIEIAGVAWEALCHRLDLAFSATQSATNETSAILSEWLQWMAPTFDHVDIDDCCRRITEIVAARNATAPPHEVLVATWRESYWSWHTLRDRLRPSP